MWDVILIFLILSLVLFIYLYYNEDLLESFVSNVYGDPMYLVNDGLFSQTNDLGDLINPDPVMRYNDTHSWLSTSLINGDTYVNSVTGKIEGN